MEKKYQKRYIVLGLIILIVFVLIWRVSNSFAFVNQGYTGKNIVSGDKWGVNVIEITDINTTGKAELIGDVSTIGTTINFDVMLFEPGDKVSFVVNTENTSILDAELYALTLSGLSKENSEYINYQIIPIDSSVIHTSTTDGSILKSGDRQMFRVDVEYNSNANHEKEYSLSLGSTIIYKQK